MNLARPCVPGPTTVQGHDPKKQKPEITANITNNVSTIIFMMGNGFPVTCAMAT